MENSKQGATNTESLSLDHLRSFLAVVDAGSQVHAGKRLRVAQTTVSRHIERVQEYFGGRLFETGQSGPLSTRGTLVEQAFLKAMAELTRTRDRLADPPVLRIGFIRPARQLVEKALRSQVKAQRKPDFEVRLLELTSEAQARALTHGALDIAISYAVPELATRSDIEASLVTEEPFALAIPERAWVHGKPSPSVLATLAYAHMPRRISNQLAVAAETWLKEQGIVPKRTIECLLGSEILAYAGAGRGYGFLPALWSMANHEGVVFAPVKSFGATAKIAAYSLRHVTSLVTRLREDLSAAASAALKTYRAS